MVFASNLPSQIHVSTIYAFVDKNFVVIYWHNAAESSS